MIGIVFAAFKTVIRTKIFVYFALSVLMALFFEEVVDDVFSDPFEGDNEAADMDRAIVQWVRGLRTPVLTQIMTDLTSLGSFSVLALFSLALFTFLLFKRLWFEVAQLVISGIGVMTLVPALKIYFNRERPNLQDHLVKVTDLSFPSGHSFGAAALYCVFGVILVSVLVSRTQKSVATAFLIAVITLVAASRIYLGVHHATDTMAGLAGGLCWTFLVASTAELIRTKYSRRVGRML